VRAPLSTARTQATPTPVAQDSQRQTDVASDSLGVPVDDAFRAVQERGTSLGQFAVVLDGSSDLTVLRSVEGGVIVGEVAEQRLGPELLVKKHLSTISYEPFTMRIGMNMSKGFADWIEASFDGEPASENGTVIAANSNLHSLSEREFRDALISEVTFPTLDASSRDPAFLTVKLEPGRINYKSSAGDLNFDSSSSSKKWLASNFRVEIGDLPTSRVSKIDSFTWKQAIVKDEVGQFREPTLEPTAIEMPNITLTISTADIQPWLDWHKDFVIDGKASDADELTGAITFLGPDLEEELAVIELSNIGMVKLSLDQAEANKESVARFTVELYVEGMGFEFLADTVSSTSLKVTSTPVPARATSAPEVPVTATPAPAPVVTPNIIVVPTADTSTDTTPKVQLLPLPDMVGPTVTVQYSLFDSTSDLVSVDVAFSIDQGRTFRKASRAIRGEGTSGLSSSPTGVGHTFSWNAGADIASEQASEVLLRVVPFDGASKGRPETSEPFEYHALLDQVSRLCRIGSKDWTLSARLWDGLRTSLSRCQNDLLEQIESLLQETEPDLGATLLSKISVQSNFDVLNGMLDSVDAGTVRLQEISGAVVSRRVSISDLNESLRIQESLIDELDARLSSIGDDAQLANIDLQNSLQKQQQILQTISNVSKMLHDTAMAVIRKIG
ncbi:MAG: phage tail protein, partial [Chloroflexi bacterium]|nr:phage tail protein [Chloroflexota bacterium]